MGMYNPMWLNYINMYIYISGWWLSHTCAKMMDFVSWDDDIPNMMGK